MKYSEAREMIRTGDGIGCRGYDLTQRIIRQIKGGKYDYSHYATVVLSLDDTGTKRVRILEAVDSGMEFHYLSSIYEACHGDIFWIPMQNTPEQQKTIKELAYGMVETPTAYDWWATIFAAFKPITLDIKKLNCSESAWWLQRACNRVSAVFDKKGKEIAPVPGDMPVWCQRVRGGIN